MNSSLRLALLSSALASVAVAATAGDLPTRKTAVPPPVLVTSMWDGLYMGITGADVRIGG